MLASTDEYMHERAHDVDDVMNRIIRNIQDQQLYSRLEGSSVIVTETLTPADTVVFSRNQVLGYATDLGGVTSHAALLSRSLKIPAVVGLRHVDPDVGKHLRVLSDHALIVGEVVAEDRLAPVMGRVEGAPERAVLLLHGGRIGGQEVPHLHAHIVGGPEPVGPMLKRD